jgi:hypothetical protein
MLSLLEDFRPRPVALTCAYPPAECARRLAGVTSQRGYPGWRLDLRNLGRPEPRLRGQVSGQHASVARLKHHASGRHSFAAWLDVRLEPSPGGGTALTGLVGVPASVRAALAIVAGIFALLVLTAAGAGVELLAAGRLAGALPIIAAALAAAALAAVVRLFGVWAARREIPRLLAEVNAILDSTP